MVLITLYLSLNKGNLITFNQNNSYICSDMASRNTQKVIYILINNNSASAYESMNELILNNPNTISINTLSKYMKQGFYSHNNINIYKCQLKKRRQGGKGKPFGN